MSLEKVNRRHSTLKMSHLGRASSKLGFWLVLSAYNEEMSISCRLAPEDADEFDDIDDELDEDDDKTDLTAGDEGVDDV
jgi:hypothetical protein